MNAQEFCYWLQGLFEVGNPNSLNAEQTKQIKDHLGLVFDKVTGEPSVHPDAVRRTTAPGPGLRPLPIARDHTHRELVKYC